MVPTIKQMATAFKTAIGHMLDEGHVQSRGLDMIMSHILANVTGISLHETDMGTLFHWQITHPITENAIAFRNEGLRLYYDVKGDNYRFTVQYEQHKYDINLPWSKGPMFEYSSNTLH